LLVKDVIKIAKEMRPGNDYDNEIIERWIDECDSDIQLNIALKKQNEIIRLRPELWERNKKYKKGTRVGVIISGDYNVFVAKNDVTSQVLPQDDADNWENVPYETYVTHPHDKLYYLYVIAMMDFANHEYDKYANDMEVYNAAYDDFAKWWQRKYRYNFREGYDAYKAER
jgi:hypothetical protein